VIRLLLKPKFYRALVRDMWNAIRLAYYGPVCQVTGEHVAPQYRAAHEHQEHPYEGPCVLL
jgi:hypothetical protein